MVELGCQYTDWVSGNDKEVLDAILLPHGLILTIGHGQREMWLSWVHFWLVWGPDGAPRVTAG